MFYKILSYSNQIATILISKESKIAELYKNGALITLFAGKKSKKATVQISNEVEKDTIMASKEVISALSIKEGMDYQLICKNKRIRIGPIMGLLIFTQKKSITKEALKKMLDYTLLYNRVKGLLCVFSVDGIDFDNNSVNGYCYNPLEHTWEEGIFPFPDAIYRRVLMPKKTLEQLQKATNNRVYNSLNFNKLDLWDMASSYEQVSEHLPMTKVYKSINDIDEMFESYKTLYLKPVNSTRAFGLMRLTKNKGVYSIQEKMEEEPQSYTSKEELEHYIETFRKGRNYLVQQGVDLLNFDNRFIDFRVIMQKNHYLKWQCTKIITSIGKQGGICSNYNIDDKYMSYEDFFDKYFTISKEEIFQKKQEIIGLCEQACAVLDNGGENYADLGIDVGFDKNLKPWIFEINNRRHSHEMCLYVNDYDSYFRAKSNPIIYGVKLSKFNVL